jgi:hypothetical protein
LNPKSPRALLALLTLFAVALLALPGLASASAWTSPFSVSGKTTYETSAEGGNVVIDDAGNATYVWGQDVAGSEQILAQVHLADGTVGQVEEVTDPSQPGEPSYPQVGIDGEGHVLVAWVRTEERCPFYCEFAYHLEAVRLDSLGAPIGEPIAFAETQFGEELSIEGIDLAVAPDGTAALATSIFDRNTEKAQAAAWKLDPGSEAPVDISPEFEGNITDGVEIGIGANDDIFASWARYEGTNYNEQVVEGAFLSEAEAAQPIVLSEGLEVASSSGGMPSVAADGTATVVFNSQFLSSPQRVFAAVVAPDGSVTGPTPVSPESAGYPSAGAGGIATLSDGSVLVAWEDQGQVWISKVSPAGAVGAPQKVEESGEADYPVLGTNGTGAGFVVFQDWSEGGTEERGIAARRLGAGGALEGQVEILEASSDELNQELYPEGVAVAADGDAAAAWETQTEEGSFYEWRYEINGAIYDATPPLVSMFAPAKALVGQETVFAADATDRNPVTYAWDFGGGATATGPVAQHTFAAPGTYKVSVTATDSAGNSATKEASVEVVEAAGAGAGANRTVLLPDTFILKAPPKKSRKRTAVLSFVASVATDRFECAIDQNGWKPCRSPLRLKKLKPGKHWVAVRAFDPAGYVDPTPATLRFTVLKGKAHKKRHSRGHAG